MVYWSKRDLWKLDPNTKKMEVFEAPKGQGPYGISTTPDGQVYFVSLAGSYLAKIDLETGNATVINPPTVRSRGKTCMV